jgi:hypothetical protein
VSSSVSKRTSACEQGKQGAWTRSITQQVRTGWLQKRRNRARRGHKYRRGTTDVRPVRASRVRRVHGGTGGGGLEIRHRWHNALFGPLSPATHPDARDTCRECSVQKLRVSKQTKEKRVREDASRRTGPTEVTPTLKPEKRVGLAFKEGG